MAGIVTEADMFLIHFDDLNGGDVLPAEIGHPKDWHLNKPEGERLLWTSPEAEDGGWGGWFEWCKAEEFKRGYEDKRVWRLRLAAGAKMYKIDCMSDLQQLIALYRFEPRLEPQMAGIYLSLDWRDAARDFEGVWLTDEGQWATRMTGPDMPSLYGWDCETVLMFNPRNLSVVDLEIRNDARASTGAN